VPRDALNSQPSYSLAPVRDTPGSAFERIRTKITTYFDPAPARQDHGQPATRFVLPRRFLGGQLHGTNRPAEEAFLLFLFQCCFFRCRLSVPKLKPRFLQNSLRRMPLLTNSVTSC
jgi:hypothetical protein